MFRLFLISAVCALAHGNFIPENGRIIGGKDTPIERVPYQLAIKINNFWSTYMCGGSILSEKYALTAGHCYKEGIVMSSEVRAGSNYYNKLGTEHNVVRYVVHPKYKFERQPIYDFTVLEVETPFALGQPGIQAIPLANEEPKVNEVALVSGYGRLSFDGSVPNFLQSVEVLIVDREICARNYTNQDFEIQESHVCAGVEQGGKDACSGDYGGPLIVNGRLAGVTSWGYGCALEGYPGVYGNVVLVKDWIREQTGL